MLASERPTRQQIEQAIRELAPDSQGIWVPRVDSRPVEQLPQGLADMMVTYVTYEELTGSRANSDELVKLVKSGDRNGWLQLCCVILTLIHSDRTLQSPVHRGLTRLFIPHEWRTKLAQELRQTGDARTRAVFFEHQILTLIKYVLLFSTVKRRPPPVETFGKAALIAGDLAESEFTRDQNEDGTAAREPLEESIIRLLLFQAHDSFRNLLVRYYTMFCELSDSVEARSHKDYLNINDHFLKLTGLSFAEYFAFGLAWLALHIEFNATKGRRLVAESLIVNIDSMKESMQPKRKMLDRLLSNISVSPTKFRDEFMREWLRGGTFYYSTALFDSGQSFGSTGKGRLRWDSELYWANFRMGAIGCFTSFCRTIIRDYLSGLLVSSVGCSRCT